MENINNKNENSSIKARSLKEIAETNEEHIEEVIRSSVSDNRIETIKSFLERSLI